MASSAEKADKSRGALRGEGDPSARDLDGRNPALLGIHGFGGTPLEVELVLDVARALGRRAHLPLLPGHGTHADDLARTGFSDWLGAAERGLLGVASERAPAVVVGLSLGSLLATKLALDHPQRVRGLVLLANAFWLARPFPAWPLTLASALRLPDFRVPKVAADIADPAARRTHLTYGEQPVHAASAVQEAGARLRGELGRVRVPTLILHGARDRVCPVANAERVRARLGSPNVRVVLFPRSRHILTRDVERREVARELRRFVEELGG